jgi:hypothetical protein
MEKCQSLLSVSGTHGAAESSGTARGATGHQNGTVFQKISDEPWGLCSEMMVNSGKQITLQKKNKL